MRSSDAHTKEKVQQLKEEGSSHSVCVFCVVNGQTVCVCVFVYTHAHVFDDALPAAAALFSQLRGLLVSSFVNLSYGLFLLRVSSAASPGKSHPASLALRVLDLLNLGGLQGQCHPHSVCTEKEGRK